MCGSAARPGPSQEIRSLTVRTRRRAVLMRCDPASDPRGWTYDQLGPTAHATTRAPRRVGTRSVAMSAGLSGLHVSRGRGGPYRVDRTDRCESRAGRRGWLSVRVCQLPRGEVEGRSRSRPTSIQRPSRCTTQAAGAEQASGRLVDTDSRRPRVSFQGCRVVVPHDSRTPHSRSHGAL